MCTLMALLKVGRQDGLLYSFCQIGSSVCFAGVFSGEVTLDDDTMTHLLVQLLVTQGRQRSQPSSGHLYGAWDILPLGSSRGSVFISIA